MKETKPFIEIGECFKEPDYKSELIIGNITIRLTKKLNCFNRLMFKLIFGIEIREVKK